MCGTPPPALVANPAAFGFRRGDLFRYSAKWWSYLVPPVEHPLLGAPVQRFWSAAGVGVGLLEQQVTLGSGIIGLGLIACYRWLFHDRHTDSLSRVPVLVIVAVVALVCSLSPERDIGSFTFVRPSAFLFSVAPMFRSYARFGVVVQLMAALLAGIGIDYLWRTASRRAQIACLVLVALAAGEYAVVPSALSRDVLPTAAHRWVMEQPGDPRTLDCIPHDPDSESVEWLSNNRVTLLGRVTSDCTEPDFSAETGGDRIYAPDRAAEHCGGEMVRGAAGAGRIACCRGIRGRTGVRPHSENTRNLYRNDDRVLSTRAR